MAVPVPVLEVNEAPWLQTRRNDYSAEYILPGIGYAPMGVFFEGWKSTPHAKAATYTWTPGDGRTTPMIGGFNFFHVYETPGVYTATLTITDGADEATATTVITVNANTGTTYYVDSDIGNDANTGTDPESAWKTWNKAVDGMSSKRYNPGDRILFKRGQTFPAYSGDFVGAHWQFGWGGYYFGAYGTGAKPIIKWSTEAAGTLLQVPVSGMHKVAFVDLALDLESPSGNYNAAGFTIQAQSNDVLFLRCDMTGSMKGYGDYMHGFFMKDCTGGATTSNVNLYTTSFRFAMTGCTLTGGDSHNMYCGRMYSGYMRDNDVGLCGRDRHVLRISEGNNIYITENQFTAHPSEPDLTHYCNVHFATNTYTEAKQLDNLFFEYNTVTNGDCQMNVGSCNNSCFRYNLFEGCRSQNRLGQITIGGLHGYDWTGCSNLEFYGNITELGDTYSAGHRNAAFYIRDEASFIPSLRTGVPRALHTNVVIHNNLIAVDPDEMMYACRWAEQRAEVDFYSNTVYKTTGDAIASYANLGTYTALKSFAEFAATYEGVNTANVLILTAYERPDDFLPDPPSYDPEEPPEDPEDPGEPEDPPPTEEEIGDWVYFYGWVAPTGQEPISVDAFIPCQGWVYMPYFDLKARRKFESRPKPQFRATPRPEFEAN